MATRDQSLQIIADFPNQLQTLIAGLTPTQLTTPYNAPEWTIAQNVHHVADSHMNSFIRLKLILTEDNPTVKPYNQETWAQTSEAQSADIVDSLAIVRGLHARWVALFRSLTDEQWERTGYHPEYGPITPNGLVEAYADHCQAHLQQIRDVLAKMG